MDEGIFGPELISVLQSHHRVKRDRGKRPMFIFCCGGDINYHYSRIRLTEYVNASARPGLKNVFCITAENMSELPEFSNMDLLTQEVMISDVSDSLILFAESVGSFCELGAFAALPHVQSIMCVAIDKKYSNSKSFLNGGPIRVVREGGFPLNGVFAVALDYPMGSPDFSAFVNSIRFRVNESENVSFNKRRKDINRTEGRINVGSLVHELLDLVYLLGPIEADELIDIYCAVKRFKRRRAKIVSLTIDGDLKRPKTTKISFDQAIAFMKAMDIIAPIEADNGCVMYYAKLSLEDCFMFKGTDTDDFRSAISSSQLAARGRGRKGFSNVYRRFD